MTRCAFLEAARVRNPAWGQPVLFCIVQPALLAEEVRCEVLSGIRQTGSDFVVFADKGEAHALLGQLPTGTTLLEL